MKQIKQILRLGELLKADASAATERRKRVMNNEWHSVSTSLQRFRRIFSLSLLLHLLDRTVQDE